VDFPDHRGCVLLDITPVVDLQVSEPEHSVLTYLARAVVQKLAEQVE
jgi:hypothetical protein